MWFVDNVKNLFTKKDIPAELEKSFNSFGWGWDFLGNDIRSCGDITITLNTFYQIQKYNTAAQSLKDKVAQEVCKGWFFLEQDGDVVDNPEALNSVKEVFSTPTTLSFANDYFTHYFAASEIFMAPMKFKIWQKAVVVDNRTMSKAFKDGRLVGYKQSVRGKTKRYSTDEMYNHIIKRDPDRPYNGMSKYFPIVYDALASTEVGKRNYYFFRNSARPDVIVMFQQMPGKPAKEYKEQIKQFEEKYQGSNNAYRVMGSNAISDVKVLDVNHKDLQLLELDKMGIKKMGMIFGIDPRLLGFSDDVGAYATMSEIAKHSMEAFRVYREDFEFDLNNFYKKFVDENFPYTIKCHGGSFTDDQATMDGLLRQIDRGLITPSDARMELGFNTDQDPDALKRYYIANNIVPIEQTWATQL